MKSPDYSVLKDRCVLWIRDWFRTNGNGCRAVLGMSGGKDSTVAAALCAEAIGKDKVTGVAMPAEGQGLNDADKICEYLGIGFVCVPIGEIIRSFHTVRDSLEGGFSVQCEQNIPPRVRMTVLYAVSQSLGGRVVNTCNLSEDWIGYATRWGDGAGDFSPLGGLTVQEIRGMGHAMGLPAEWVDKTPDDGLPHSCSDEQKFGFSYETLDRYIRTGVCDDPAVREKIDRMHNGNLFKMEMPPKFEPYLK
ncbi:MAG: NAD(+) synthase [Bacteroidales bacterium]|nr:NAD(+) synthase [Bacteroidales bacterium]